MTEIILADAEYTFDASEKTITLAAPYTTLSTGQIVLIKNITKNLILYDSGKQGFEQISVSGDVITHTAGNTGHGDTDKLKIIVDAVPSGASIQTAPYSKVLETSPARANILRELVFNAQAVDAPATGVDTSQHTDLAFIAELTGLTGIVKAYDSIDGTTKGAELEFMLSGTKVTEINTTTTTAKYHCLFANCAPHYIIFDLSSRTAGSVTLYMLGKGV